MHTSSFRSCSRSITESKRCKYCPSSWFVWQYYLRPEIWIIHKYLPRYSFPSPPSIHFPYRRVPTSGHWSHSRPVWCPLDVCTRRWVEAGCLHTLGLLYSNIVILYEFFFNIFIQVRKQVDHNFSTIACSTTRSRTFWSYQDTNLLKDIGNTLTKTSLVPR